MVMYVILGLVLFEIASFVLLLFLAAWDTQSNGWFVQPRVGQHGHIFSIYKLRTMHRVTGRISVFGRFLRRTKLDELPQLYNVLRGDMTLIGPRPDVPGYADQLLGEDRLILLQKPGLTGLASLKYRNEEDILDLQSDPKMYNDQVIWPDKIRIHKWYAQNRTFWLDVQIVFLTFFPFVTNVSDWVDQKVNGKW